MTVTATSCETGKAKVEGCSASCGAGATQSVCTCGGDTDEPSEYITGGQLTRSFAATGALVHYNQNAICTGTLVAQNKVLTAAHCVDTASPGSLSFVLGVDLSQSQLRSNVLSIDIHPNWVHNQFENGNDLAVLTLASPITGVQPAVLLVSSSPTIGQQMTLVGYGRTSGDFVTGIRRLARVSIGRLTQQSIGYQFKGEGACQGDSGGPAFVEAGGRWWQIGVTSYGDQNCTQYGFYQRVDLHKAWLSGRGVPVQETQRACEQDSSCNGACEEDADCWSSMCPDGSCTAPNNRCLADGSCDPDCGSSDADCGGALDYCQRYNLYGNGYCDQGCSNPDPDCQAISCTPSYYMYDNAFCYWYDYSGRMCGQTAIYCHPYYGCRC
ncbi:S1 family peptidase [Archangium violaceum]|uniref:S1 family peptidase n=1 Tax=Archangium violaceum TaxID=83451 RepID=UPI003D27B26E